jgi:hypothetical protein
MTLDVNRKTIPELLSTLQRGVWQIPAFQREFVWKQSQVYQLIDSVFRSRPIGLVTLWQQPQGRPHTAATRVRLRTAEFSDGEGDPAQISLVLDGRQRLTSLAIAFGGLRETDGKMLFSGSWFLNLDKDPKTEDIVVYKKKSDVAREQLNNPSLCVARGLLPLDAHASFQSYLSGIYDSTRYPDNQLPAREVLAARAARLEEYSKTFLQFQVPLAELPSAVTLAEVCDIFDVLNQTGTRVSTFDLMHNTIFADTSGRFELRRHLKQWNGDLPNFGLLCSEDRPDYLCQVVTGCYLSESDPVGRKSDTSITSIKGGDLIDTPTIFYERFAQQIAAVDSCASTLFSRDVLGTRATLAELPYPTSAILFFSLSWAREQVLPEQRRFPPSRMSQLFRAFFWSNVLTGRYDQGFLTQFAKDRKTLLEILQDGNAYQADSDWARFADDELEKRMFGLQSARRSQSELRELMLDGNLRGAIQDGVRLYMHASITSDLIDGSPLDRFASDQAKQVDLHHFYPQDWCKNNKERHDLLRDEDRSVVNSFANLTPLRAGVNKQWKAKEPLTAFAYFGVSLDELGVQRRLGQAFIGSEAIVAIKDGDVSAFLQHRAGLLADGLVGLQFVAGAPATSASVLRNS